MRFDVPLVSVALLGAAQAAAFPPAYGQGYNGDHQFGGRGRLGDLEKEIARLEGQLKHDLKAIEAWQNHWRHGGPRPYHGAAPSYGTAAPSGSSPMSGTAPAPSVGTAAPSYASAYNNFTATISSPADSSSAVASASSYVSSLSSQASFVSCIYETVTNSPSSSLVATATGYSPDSTATVDSTSTVTVQATTTVISVGTVYYTVPYTPTTTSGSEATSPAGSPAGYTSEGSSPAGYTSEGSAPAGYTSEGSAPAGYTSEASSAAGYTSEGSSPSGYTSAGNSPAGYTSEAQSSAYTAPANYPSSEESSTIAYTSLATPVSYTSYVGAGSSYEPSMVTVSSAYSGSSLPPFPYPAGNDSYPSAYSGSSAIPSGYAGTKTLSPPVATGASTTFTASFSTTFASSASISANSTSAFVTGTAAPVPTSAANVTAPSNVTDMACSSLCDSLSFDIGYTVTPISCTAYSAGDNITISGGQADVGCGTAFTAEVDLCRVALTITTTGISEAYSEVWLPNGNSTAWNGRTMSTDNGGANGCVAFDDMQYTTGLGFAAIGDNGGHNSSAFDAGWFYFQNEEILDWVYRAKHVSVMAGKQVVDQFYGQAASYSYYMGCSTGGQQGMHSAQYFPDDFDGIIAGSGAADFNHLQGWSARFVQLTGNTTSASFLTEDQWILVQSYIFDQCDAALDGVDDGILEDPTICQFDPSAIPVCEGESNSTCLTSTQVSTVYNVFSELYNADGELLYPQMSYGSQVDAFRLGMLAGSTQAIAAKWYGGGVFNDSNYDATTMGSSDYAAADAVDELHGHISSFNGDLSAFNAAGGKMIMYHGMSDPLVSGANTQRYYLKVAKTLGLDNTGLDGFMRYFRISGMAHCGVGGISGAGAWMFGQNGLAAPEGIADNVIWNMVDWVESGNAPEVITGTKFWWDETDLGVEFQRPHCRFPYRTTFSGEGDWTDPSTWTCEFIDDWQECGVGAVPRLCNADGTFT